MSGKINTILLLLFCLTFLPECQKSMIPASYLQSPADATIGIKGSWIVLNTHNDTLPPAEESISGELIAIQSDTVYLLTDSALIAVNSSMINSAVLYLFKPQTAITPIIAGLSYVPNVIGAIAKAEGAFLLIGAPLLITGALMSAIESAGNVMKYPDKYQLTDLTKFARFPQGLPSGLDPEKLHLK